MSDVLFDLRNVRQLFGETVALDLAELQIRSGEILCLLGPTGSGKSTLLRRLAGVETPTSGEIQYRGQSLTDGSVAVERQRQITLVFQRPILLTGNVRSNVDYGVRLRGQSGIDDRVNHILDRFGLTALADQPARTLSGGQTQLVALARALILEPEVLLLDEPTANLDPAHVAMVERVLQEDFVARKTTIVWATHHLFQARRVASRVALMLNGRLIEVAETDAFFETPTDPRTRDFVDGRMIY